VRFAREAPGTPVREAQEFGTLLNSTARYGRPEVGLAVAGGDRDPAGAYGEALDLLLDHRKHLAGALDVLARTGVHERTAVQWVHLEDRVRDTVVGIVCGMALDGLGLRRDLALVGFAWTPDGQTKVSTRGPHELQGGGHKGAAGATIPRGSEPRFLGELDLLVGRQVGLLPAVPPSQVGQTRLPL
jgi:single-stranded-DNA-specific exonuclease